ncbi:mechanosensitive ion channel family protein [Apibacter sp. B3706]|uniref:mechanosensitive ion channel family protein n=1 Tax=unclassified Apibacter TaxID=2630820 RepID=UPI000CF9112B|nr:MULTISPECIES: mechanosensitive ion channel family protein [unclassified Apibacter]PQL92294.1 mechanosensitive ion channel protein MscS [Apibacter sp. wkB309]QII71101.1 mechanosensitive ion channel family protein [Apibacter sp. B3706]
MELLSKFFKDYHLQLIATIIVIMGIYFLKLIINKIILKYGNHTHIKELRTRVVIKYSSILINILGFVLLITIWGVTPEWIFATFASFFAIVGVAFFAQWSLLSNVTAGFIIYFTVPFRIGDIIKIIDKDNPITATVEDIKAFYVVLRTDDGFPVTFPNNLILQKAILTLKAS